MKALRPGASFFKLAAGAVIGTFLSRLKRGYVQKEGYILYGVSVLLLLGLAFWCERRNMRKSI